MHPCPLGLADGSGEPKVASVRAACCPAGRGVASETMVMRVAVEAVGMFSQIPEMPSYLSRT